MKLLHSFLKLSAYRQILWLVFAIGFSGSVVSLTMQYAFGFNPCVMCIQQRVSMMVLTLVALLMLLLPVRWAWARLVAAVGVSVPTVFGAYIAAKQMYIQSLPITEQPSCGAPWTFRLRGAPLFEWYEPIIRGTGLCGKVETLLGLSLPTWALLFFVAVLGLLWGGLIYAKWAKK